MYHLCHLSYHLSELLDELSLAKLSADGSCRRSIKKYTKVDVLVMDEWLLTDLTPEEASMLLEITEARHKVSSTIFCSQIDPSGWHLKLGNETIVEAILDRIIHDSYQILIDGEISMRERHGLEGGFSLALLTKKTHQFFLNIRLPLIFRKE